MYNKSFHDDVPFVSYHDTKWNDDTSCNETLRQHNSSSSFYGTTFYEGGEDYAANDVVSSRRRRFTSIVERCQSVSVDESSFHDHDTTSFHVETRRRPTPVDVDQCLQSLLYIVVERRRVLKWHIHRPSCTTRTELHSVSRRVTTAISSFHELSVVVVTLCVVPRHDTSIDFVDVDLCRRSTNSVSFHDTITTRSSLHDVSRITITTRTRHKVQQGLLVAV